MNTESLRVNMLGEFSISWKGHTISDSGNRMRKVWLLLAYLIYRHDRPVTQNEIISLLWENGEEQVNLQGSLKTMLYRARAMLDQLEEGAGHALILRQGKGYILNPEVPVVLDVEKFDRLYAEGTRAENDTDRLTAYSEALALYDGDFLEKLSMESWVVPISAYYHKQFLKMSEETLAIMEKEHLWEDAAALCKRALKIEPYSEALYCHLMRNHLASGNNSAAVAVYEEMSDLLFSTFGVMPSDEARAIYRQALNTVNDQSVPVSTVRENLRETGTEKGALFCEYDYFKTLYRLMARSIARSGDTVHIAVLSVTGKEKKPLSRKSLDRVMENLQNIITTGLRQGDVVTRCSVSQFIMMLPQANYENSCMVCGRVIRAYFREYPHSPAQIHFTVQPLEPRLGTNHE